MSTYYRPFSNMLVGGRSSTVGREWNGGFRVVDGNKQNARSLELPTAVRSGICDFRVPRRDLPLPTDDKRAFPQEGVRSLIDTVFSHDDGRRSSTRSIWY